MGLGLGLWWLCVFVVAWRRVCFLLYIYIRFHVIHIYIYTHTHTHTQPKTRQDAGLLPPRAEAEPAPLQPGPQLGAQARVVLRPPPAPARLHRRLPPGAPTTFLLFLSPLLSLTPWALLPHPPTNQPTKRRTATIPPPPSVYPCSQPTDPPPTQPPLHRPSSPPRPCVGATRSAASNAAPTPPPPRPRPP